MKHRDTSSRQAHTLWGQACFGHLLPGLPVDLCSWVTTLPPFDPVGPCPHGSSRAPLLPLLPPPSESFPRIHSGEALGKPKTMSGCLVPTFSCCPVHTRSCASLQGWVGEQLIEQRRAWSSGGDQGLPHGHGRVGGQKEKPVWAEAAFQVVGSRPCPGKPGRGGSFFPLLLAGGPAVMSSLHPSRGARGRWRASVLRTAGNFTSSL